VAISPLLEPFILIGNNRYIGMTAIHPKAGVAFK